MDDKFLINTLIIMAGIESKQPGAMPLEDNPLFVAAQKLKELEALKAQVDGLTDALSHIAKTCSASRTRTRRLAWISSRANSAINGNDNWKDMDIPKSSSEESQQSLRLKLRDLKAQVEQLQQELSVEQEMVSNYHDTNSALAAQVEQLREVLRYADNKLHILTHNRKDVSTRLLTDADKGYKAVHEAVLGFKDNLNSLVAKRDAEIKAQAIDEFFSQVRYMEGLNVPDICESATEYANQLRQAAKGGE